MKTKILFRAAAVTMLTVFSCSKEIEPEITPIETPEETVQGKTYTITVNAEKGEPATKALTLEGNTLSASWKQGETVDVYKGEVQIGTLTAQSTGPSTTLKGTVSEPLAVRDELTLKFCSPSYDNQGGTLEYIATHCDYATALVAVSGIDEGAGTISISDASFVSQQAIVKFTLWQAAAPTSGIKPKTFSLTAGDATITVTPPDSDPTNNEVFVAVPAIDGQPISLRAVTQGETNYGYSKPVVSFEKGKFYAISVKMSKAFLVHNDTELNQANANGAEYIIFANDITRASEALTIDHDVTIDLAGHSLSRELSSPVSKGCVLIVSSTRNLKLTGGTITGGRITEGGGGLINYGTAIVSGCTFSDNIAITRGGAIWSSGSLTVESCTFTGNEAQAKGGENQNEGDGGAIHLEAGTATLTDVTITNNTSKDAGGIYVKSGATLNLGGNSTISGNSSTEHGGGGIVNYGIAKLSGSIRITGNNCHTYGGGIWNNGTLEMKGDIQVKDNTRSHDLSSNVYLKSGHVINISGDLAGSSIGLSMENVGTATSGLGGNGDLSCFFCDNAAGEELSLVGGEATLSPVTDRVYYIKRSYHNNAVTEEIKYVADGDYTELAGSEDSIVHLDNNGWYVVKGSNVQRRSLIAPTDGVANLILCDGASLSAVIIINEDCELNIYAQTKNSGKIVAEVPHQSFLGGHYPAGIGSEGDSNMGSLKIHGGDITAKGFNRSAGIGGGGSEGRSYAGNGGSVEIFGGTVKAYGGDDAAGIGAGYNEYSYGYGGTLRVYDGNVYAEGGIFGAAIGGGYYGRGGTVDVYGGRVEARGGIALTGGNSYAAGIGGGSHGSGGSVTVYGGEVYAYGSKWGAGIGSGCNYSDPRDGVHSGTLTVYDGKVDATGGAYAAGIGGGQNVSGAEVTVYGGTVIGRGGEDAAGIGSGEQQSGTINGGKLIVYGGEVYGDGTALGAGIGGGQDSDGAEVEIHGGIVTAWGGDGSNVPAIGSHLSGTEHQGSLTIDAGLMVHAGDDPGSTSLSIAGFRVSDCWYHRYASVEPCGQHEYVDGKCKWCGHSE